MTSHLILQHLYRFGTFLLLLRLVTWAVGVWLTYREELGPNARPTLGGFAARFLPKQWFTLQTVRFDAYMYALSKIEGMGLLAITIGVTALVVPGTYYLLTALFGVHPQYPSTLPLQIGVVVLAILVRDFGEFATHALCHRFDVLWEFHAVHHSSLFLTPLGMKRAHFVDDVFRTAPNIFMVSVAIGVFTYVFNLGHVENSLFGIDAYALVNVLCFETLRHSHIPLSFGPLEGVLMSPRQHHVHHKRDGAPRNFGSFLACWDRMFGTFSRSLPRGSFEIGLDPTEQVRFDSLLTLYARPFVKAWKIITSGNALGTHALGDAYDREMARGKEARSIPASAAAVQASHA
jgi:sterol desaturase/sphingolipid hydroxylase (fatty acid hydroxylase superfamily)